MFCACGCGEKTIVSAKNEKSKGWVKGVPRKYIKGHNMLAALAIRHGGPKKRCTTSHGYVAINRKYEHILIVEAVLGRKLKYISPGHPDNHVVHHINGDKQDNRKSNLLVCTHSYHTRLHYALEASPDWPEFKQRVLHP